MTDTEHARIDTNPAFVDHALDPLVERFGGEVFSRHGDAGAIAPFAITTYRWANSASAQADVELVRRLCLHMTDRHVGEIGGHGLNWLVLVVSRTGRDS